MKFDYCPKCGKHKTVVQETATKYQCTNCSFEFWNNPAATVSAVFLKDKKALFAKRAIEPNKGKYDFPGGFLEYNEDIYKGCAREIYEETRLRVDPDDLQLITGYAREYIPGQSVIDLIVIVKHWDGEFTPQDDVAGLEWKPFEFIDSDDFAPQEYKGLSKKLATMV